MSAGRLVVDIGGTNARLALSTRPGVVGAAHRVKVADYATLGDAVAAFRETLGADAPFTGAAVAGAGPVDGGEIKLTNAHWRIRADDVAAHVAPGAGIRLFNDLEAVAHALPHLGRADRATLRAAADDAPAAARLAVNVGTGFGAALAVSEAGRTHVVGGEAGHMAFGARTTEELALTADLTSVEDALSGAGLGTLRRFFEERLETGASADPERFDAAAVLRDAATDPAAAAAVRLFSGLLGRVAGDLALATNALGGVFLCGGVVEGWRGHASDWAPFWDAFGAKGKMTDRVGKIPVYAITRQDPALFGLSHAPL